MRWILHTIAGIGLAALAAAIQIAASLILPDPLQLANVIFAAFIIVMVAKNTGIVIWLAAAAYLLLEPFMTAPFGLTLGSAMFGMLVGYWMHETVFTNRSWYAAALLSIVSVAAFRIGYGLCALALSAFGMRVPSGGAGAFLAAALWESGLTAALVAFGSIVISFFFPSLRSKDIRA